MGCADGLLTQYGKPDRREKAGWPDGDTFIDEESGSRQSAG